MDREPVVGETVKLNKHGLKFVLGLRPAGLINKDKTMNVTRVELLGNDPKFWGVDVDDAEINLYLLTNHDFDAVATQRFEKVAGNFGEKNMGGSDEDDGVLGTLRKIVNGMDAMEAGCVAVMALDRLVEVGMMSPATYRVARSIVDGELHAASATMAQVPLARTAPRPKPWNDKRGLKTWFKKVTGLNNAEPTNMFGVEGTFESRHSAFAHGDVMVFCSTLGGQRRYWCGRTDGGCVGYTAKTDVGDVDLGPLDVWVEAGDFATVATNLSAAFTPA